MPRVVRPIRKCVILAAVATLSVSAATAQEPTPPPPDSLRPSLELFGGWIRSSSDIAGRYDLNSTGIGYRVVESRPWGDVVAALPYTVVGSTTFQGQPPNGLDVGANLFATSRVGVQVRFDYSRARLQGPDWAYVFNWWEGVTESPSKPITGNTSLKVVSIGPVVRGRIGRRVVWNASAGFSQIIHRWTWTRYGFVFPNRNMSPLPVTIKDSAKTAAANVGASLLISLKGPFAFAIDYRYTGGGTRPLWSHSADSVNLTHTRLMVGLNITPWRKRQIDLVDGWKAR